MARQNKTTKQPVKQKLSRNAKRLIDPEPFPNDWLEWAIILVAATGVGGGIFALLYLARLNGAI